MDDFFSEAAALMTAGNGAAAGVIRFAAVWLIALLFATGLFIARKQRLRLWLTALPSVGLAYGLNAYIGFLFPRERPFQTLDVSPLFYPVTEKSFPSDHAALAFAFAATLLMIDRRLGILTMVCALCIAIARVFAGVHYLSDVIAGAIIGILSAFAIRQLYKV